MYTFSELLRQIRGEGNLTQAELAKILGVSTILISMIETDQKEASKAFIRKLADKLETHPSSIMPFMFFEDDIAIKKLSGLERTLISLGEEFQNYLIRIKSKKLKKYA